jgi:PAS domain S-box-containing protein
MYVNHTAKKQHRWLKAAEVWRRRLRQRPSPDLHHLTALFSPDLLYEWHPAQDFALYFGDIDTRLGYAPGEFPRTWRSFEAVVHPDDLPQLRAALQHSLETRQPFDQVYRVVRKDGSLRYWRDRGQGIPDKQGDLACIVGVNTDITEQYEAEEALKELNATLEMRVAERNAELQHQVDQRRLADARFQMISELTSDFGYQVLLRPDGGFDIEWVSDGTTQLLGYSFEEISNSEKWISKIHPDDRWITIENVSRTARGETGSGIVRFMKPDGSFIWLEIYNKPVMDAAGTHIDRIIGAGRDITKRKQAEVEHSESQARYQTLFDESPVSLWEEDFSALKAALDSLRLSGVSDFRQYFRLHREEAMAMADLIKVFDVNRAARKLYDDRSKEYLVQNLGQVIREYPERWIEQLVAISEGRTDFELEGSSIRADAVLLHTVIHVSVVRGYEHNFGRVIVSVQNLTARRRAEDALRKEARRLELTNQITLASLSLGNLKQTLRTLSERMCEFGGADACFITRWDAERQTPILLSGTADIENQFPNLFQGFGDASITRAVLEAGEVLVARSDDPRPLIQRYVVLSGGRSALALPLQVGAEKIGAAVLVYPQPPAISENDLEMWQGVAAQVSLAIASLQLFERAQRRAEELEKLTRVSSELRVAQASEEILALLVREMVQIVDADRGALVIRRDGKWVLEAEKNDPEFGSMGEMYLSDEIAAQILRQAQDYFFSDPMSGAHFPHCPWQQGLDALTVIPLNTAEEVIGLVAIGWRHPKELTAVDRRLLTAVAEMGGNALHRSGLLETLEQRVADRTRDLQILFNLSALSNGQHGLKKVLESALKQLMIVMGGTAGVVHLVNIDKQSLEVEISLGLPRAVVDQMNHLPTNTERLLKNFNQQRLLIIKETPTLPIPAEILIEQGFNASICVPIQASGQSWGIVSILGDLAKLNPGEQSLLMAVADLIATAAENAQLQKSAKDVAVMEERQRLARALHDSVTQSLYSLTLFSEAGREHSLAGNQERTLHYLERSSETAHRALREMRMLLYELRPPELDRLGLPGALRYRLEAVEQRIGLEARFTVRYRVPVPAEVEEGLFWIAQEALNNVLKHANASKVFLSLISDSSQVNLEIRDNGQGFELNAQAVGGMGLVGMRERASKIGAALVLESEPGKGTRVKVKLNFDSSGKEKLEHE